jgi:hypothetical protein
MDVHCLRDFLQGEAHMHRFLLVFVALSSLVVGAAGCGRSADSIQKASPEKEAQIRKEMEAKQKEAMEAQMKKMEQGKPQ